MCHIGGGTLPDGWGFLILSLRHLMCTRSVGLDGGTYAKVLSHLRILN